MKTRGRVLVLPAVVLALILALGGARQVLGEHKDVAGSKHDVATAGTPACINCHVPRDAAGQLLWPGGEPDPNGALAGQKRLCFSCHDGTVAPDRSYVFDPSRPEHLRTPGVAGQDCDRCHDPHEATNATFLKIPLQANFCANCHFKAGPSNHPTGVDALALGMQPVDAQFDPKAGDFSGTRLWNAAGTGPGNLVMCLTCHDPHGGQPNTKINTVLYAPDQVFSSQTLCGSCHKGGGR